MCTAFPDRDSEWGLLTREWLPLKVWAEGHRDLWTPGKVLKEHCGGSECDLG